MPVLKNTNTTMYDGGGGTKKNTKTTSTPLYGSQYGGAAAGKTGSQLGLYGSNYGGAAAKPSPSVYKPGSGTTSSSSGSLTKSVTNALSNAINNAGTIAKSALDANKGYGGDGGYSGGGGGGYSGGGGGGSSYNPMSEFESVWNKYYAAAKAAADAQRDKDLAELENEWEKARNKRNVQYLNDAKSMSRLYGARDPQYGGNYGGDTKRGGQGSFGSMYGGGWTNQLANKLGWRSDNADLLANRNTNANNVRTNYSNYLANLELQKLNNWSNVMAPYYMNQSFLG